MPVSHVARTVASDTDDDEAALIHHPEADAQLLDNHAEEEEKVT